MQLGQLVKCGMIDVIPIPTTPDLWEGPYFGLILTPLWVQVVLGGGVHTTLGHQMGVILVQPLQLMGEDIFYLYSYFSFLPPFFSRSKFLEAGRKWRSKRQQATSSSMQAMAFFIAKSTLFLAMIIVNLHVQHKWPRNPYLQDSWPYAIVIWDI